MFISFYIVSQPLLGRSCLFKNSHQQQQQILGACYASETVLHGNTTVSRRTVTACSLCPELRYLIHSPYPMRLFKLNKVNNLVPQSYLYFKHLAVTSNQWLLYWTAHIRKDFHHCRKFYRTRLLQRFHLLGFHEHNTLRSRFIMGPALGHHFHIIKLWRECLC